MKSTSRSRMSGLVLSGIVARDASASGIRGDMRIALAAASLALAGCPAPPAASPASPVSLSSPSSAAADRSAVDHTLDDFHDAAAHADEARYFAHFAPRGVFLGTDAAERWDVASFRAYAHPRFASGKAWSFHATERHVDFSADGGV